MLRIAAIGMLIGILMACNGEGEGKDSDTASEPATVAEICEVVLDMCEDGLGWQDQDQCETGWIDNADFGTTCADSEAYLACMGGCIGDETCDDFSECELSCWSDNC